MQKGSRPTVQEAEEFAVSDRRAVKSAYIVALCISLEQFPLSAIQS
jgi:hypothetical protein